MTQEQVKQLKKGDEVFVKASFECLATSGDAYVRFFWTNGTGKRILGNMAVTFDSVLLRSDLQQPAEKPKYDPCRPFRVGDIVTPIERDGREVPNGAPVGEKCTVVEPEKNGLVLIYYAAGCELHTREIPFYHLELVTPVEELEPYNVFFEGRFVHVRKGERVFVSFNLNAHPHAKEAAEAECARLNAEYRKEQSNG